MRFKDLLMAAAQGGSGAAAPVTLTLQPDATAGVDTTIQSSAHTLNRGITNSIFVGQNAPAASVFRGLIRFDLSPIPVTATVITAELSLYRFFDRSNNARTMSVYRMIRAWAEGTGNDIASGDGATWDTYDGTGNWGTAGAAHTTTDVEAASIGSIALLAGTNSGGAYATPGWDTIALNASKVTEWVSGAFANNGMKLQMATEVFDSWGFMSSDHATAANRPKLVVVYQP